MRIIHGDCLEVLKTLPDNSVDSCVTDPPYELGFMGKSWDDTGIANNVGMWREVLRVLKPGGHLLSFGGTRTYHRMACAIEDAGFEIRDQIGWAYGSGFPKSLDVSKAIDKAAGTYEPGEVLDSSRAVEGPGGYHMKEKHGTNPQSDDAKKWSGWGTALKPAWEPIVVARKPLSEGTVAANVLRWGTGGLNIDGTRVASNGEHMVKGVVTKQTQVSGDERDEKGAGMYAAGSSFVPTNSPLGRWPANLIHDGSDEVVGMFPISKSTVDKSSHAGRAGTPTFAGGEQVERVQRGDSGSAARFFYCAKASKQDRDEGLEGFEDTSAADMVDREEGSAGMNSPRAGAGRSGPRKNNHPTVKPTELMRYLCRLVTPPRGVVVDPFMGSGSTGKAAKLEGFDFVGIEKEEEYVRIAETRIAAVAETLL